MEIKNDEDLASFIEYPTEFLVDFAHEVREDGLFRLSVKDLRQLKGLFKLDNFALALAAEYGVHPLTGLIWHVKFDGVDTERYQDLINRNLEMLVTINEILRDLEE